MPTPVIIGLAGGTGSGKSTITDAIRSEVKNQITLIPQDSYYKNFGLLPIEKRNKINYDHPESFDNALLMEHLKLLKKKIPIQKPIYDFKTHSRIDKTTLIKPSKIIIV